MEYGIENCAMLSMKRGKREIIKGTELPSQESTRMLEEKKHYHHFRIIGSGKYQTSKDEKEKKGNEYLRRMRKLLETMLCSRNLIK